MPQLFVSSGAAKWNDPEKFPGPWDSPSYQTEGRTYAKYLLRERPGAKVAILFQNDDSEGYLKGMKQGLGDKAAIDDRRGRSPSTFRSRDQFPHRQAEVDRCRRAVRYRDPEICGAGDQAGRRARLEAAPLLSYVSASIGSVIKPAGFDNAQGIVSAAYFKDPDDPNWKDDAGVKELNAFLDSFSHADRSDTLIVNGYNSASAGSSPETCGDDLTRENVMRQAANLKNVELGMLLPGIKVTRRRMISRRSSNGS